MKQDNKQSNDLITLNDKQKKILYVLTFVVIAIGILFMRTYLMLIIFASIMAVLFAPVNSRYLRKGKSVGTSGFYTFLISMFVVIVPLVFIVFITGLQISSIITDLEAQNYSIDFTEIINNIVKIVNDLFIKLGIDTQITSETITNAISDTVSSIGSSLVDKIASAFSGFFDLITAAIIYIYVFLSLLKHKDTITDLLNKLNPLGDDVSKLYIDRTDAMTKATVRGQFIIAFMQGFASAAVLALVGLDNLFFFFLLLLTTMSVIPLGAGIITIPIGIIIILTGNIWQGALVILNHLIVVTNIDNIMRPKLVPKSARLDPALMILAVFSGVALFGFLGIVIGPIIMILITTTVQIYLEVFYKEESIDRSKNVKHKRFAKLSNITKKAGETISGLVD